MEPNKEVSQPQAGTQQSNIHRKKDDITPKIGQREAYRAYDSSPFDPYEKSKLYQEDYINNRVEQRMRMQEKAAEKMDQGISNKDKFITRKGQEQFYFHGNMENYYIKKTQDKYNQLQKHNEGYKVTKDQEDKYFKNYVDNAKPTTLDQIDQELYENEGKRLNKQQQYNKALNDQINSNRAMKNRFETDYKKRLDDAKRIEDEKYYKEQKIKEDNRIKSKNDFVNINQRLIDQKKRQKNLIITKMLNLIIKLMIKLRKKWIIWKKKNIEEMKIKKIDISKHLINKLSSKK